MKVTNLDFRFDSTLPFVLRDVTMEVARGRYMQLRGRPNGE